MTAQQFDDIHEFLQVAELDNIAVHEERARRIVWAGESEDIPEPTVSLGINVSGNEIRFRFRMVMADQQAEYVADFEAVYEVTDADEISVSAELQQEFARRVAFMSVYPFLRASIFSGASRLGTPRPVLGMVRQDAFEAGEVMTADDVRNTFFDNKSELQQR